MWLSPCRKAPTEKASAFYALPPRNNKCTKCGKIYTSAKLTWEPPLK